MKHADLTILIQHDEEFGLYIGQIEEFPAAISQGKTIEELQINLKDALKLHLEVQKDQLIKDYAEKKFERRIIQFA